MKIAPIVAAIEEYNKKELGNTTIKHTLVHTGQHYDTLMSDVFFQDLDIPKPDIFLGVGSGSHASQTADIMKGFESVLIAEKPDVLIVVGDVNSTVACALVASKISCDTLGWKPIIAHVEAGLRSFDRTMPEEINRIVTDRLSDLLFITEESGVVNLQNEGVPAEQIHFVGNTMIDTLMSQMKKANESKILEKLDLAPNSVANNSGQTDIPFALLTLHRPSNVDHKESFIEILQALKSFDTTMTIVFPVHPRTQKQIVKIQLDDYIRFSKDGTIKRGKLNVIDPLGYLDFLCLMKNARIVLTDSGGIQEETTSLGVPCVTIRTNTERPVTISEGTNLLAGLQKEAIIEAIKTQLSKTKEDWRIPKYWDGKAADRIVDVLAQQPYQER
jgi:UDP-N-acetylglucosamine 2-epimerase (non-hydrolysing)